MSRFLQKLRDSQRLELTFVLSLMSLFCLALEGFRVLHSGTHRYLFLAWNLFLAAVPWMLSSYVTMHANIRWKRSVFWVVLFVWLLFFPNAPYIITDLFHLKSASNMPAWFDLLLIQSFAWTGLAFGFTSLYDIEALLRKRLTARVTDAVVVAILFLSGFGVYLGRYLRWNSWDLVSRPLALLADIADRVVHPFSHSRTWGTTVLVGSLLNMMYWTLRFLRKHHSPA